MEQMYANEQSVLLLVSLLKEHGIKKVIASPGTTNLSFVASLQHDPFFEMYSCVDERSAAYMACGMAAESGEPVVITCTGATASRNYVSALTEAYYRKLPILAVTGTQNVRKIGQLYSQLIDRSQLQRDIVRLSVDVPEFRGGEDLQDLTVMLNNALNELHRDGGGPVHINLRTLYTRDFSVVQLPDVRKITRLSYSDIDCFPDLPHGRIGIFVGSHNTFSARLTQSIDNFCSTRNAVVFCDHTSGYYGKYKINFSLPAVQKNYSCPLSDLDLCIHLGEISAEYGMLSRLGKTNEVWRVNQDGEIRDQFKKLKYVFEMDESDFFEYYSGAVPVETDYIEACRKEYSSVVESIPQLPFSNVWIASILTKELPAGCSLHLGILNSTRTWNLFQIPEGVTSFANVGGFGIDGGVSSLLGASLVNRKKLYFGVVGDLAFFYDMNSLGNRHIGNNVRLLVVNNGKGTEFRNFYHTGSLFGDEADKYIAAGGHFGNKSSYLLKNFATDLNYEYLAASTKEEFLAQYKRFVNPVIGDRSIVFEVFTNSQDESDAIEAMWNIKTDAKGLYSTNRNKFANQLRKVLGKEGVAFFKKILNRK